MFERFADLIDYTKRTQNLTTTQIAELAGVCRATAFRWASSDIEPSWYHAARVLLTRPLIHLVESWAVYAGQDGAIELHFALDGSRVEVVYCGVIVGEGESLAEALESATPRD